MSAHDTDARHLIDLYDQRCRLSKQVAEATHPTAAMCAAVLAKCDELDVACSAFRGVHYPDAEDVFVGLWALLVKGGSRGDISTVLDLFGEYRARVTGTHAPEPATCGVCAETYDTADGGCVHGLYACEDCKTDVCEECAVEAAAVAAEVRSEDAVEELWRGYEK